MGNSPLPPMVRPLEDNSLLVDFIADVSKEPRQVVIQRLLDEEKCLGTNVRRDLKQAGVRPHVMSEEMIEFYRITKSFLYETVVWNRAPLKLEMRQWIGNFLKQNAPKRKLKVLSFGDGLGFDSAYLAKSGHDVTYFEVSEECIRFAHRIFDANGQAVTTVREMEELAEGSFDVIICMDVLKHVPDPPESIAMLSRLLKKDGWLLTHSPFFFTSSHRVTHLKSNRKFSGSAKMFTEHGLHLTDGRFFWDPIALVKSDTIPKNRNLRQVLAGSLILKIARYANLIHCLIAQRMSGTDKKWLVDRNQFLLDEKI